MCVYVSVCVSDGPLNDSLIPYNPIYISLCPPVRVVNLIQIQRRSGDFVVRHNKVKGVGSAV